MERKSRAAVLASGGVDSLVLLAWAATRHAEVHPLYIRFGLAWEKAELAALRRQLAALRGGAVQPLTVLNLPMKDVYGTHWSLTGRGVPDRASRDETVYLPGRNLMLLSKAAVWCAAREIPMVLTGTLGGNPFPDATPAFFRALGNTAGRGLGTKITVSTPFRRKDKTGVVALGRRLGAPLHLAFSCLAPRGTRPCRRCNKCAEKDKVLTSPHHGR